MTTWNVEWTPAKLQGLADLLDFLQDAHERQQRRAQEQAIADGVTPSPPMTPTGKAHGRKRRLAVDGGDGPQGHGDYRGGPQTL